MSTLRLCMAIRAIVVDGMFDARVTKKRINHARSNNTVMTACLLAEQRLGHRLRIIQLDQARPGQREVQNLGEGVLCLGGWIQALGRQKIQLRQDLQVRLWNSERKHFALQLSSIFNFWTLKSPRARYTARMTWKWVMQRKSNVFVLVAQTVFVVTCKIKHFPQCHQWDAMCLVWPLFKPKKVMSLTSCLWVCNPDECVFFFFLKKY